MQQVCPAEGTLPQDRVCADGHIECAASAVCPKTTSKLSVSDKNPRRSCLGTSFRDANLVPFLVKLLRPFPGRPTRQPREERDFFPVHHEKAPAMRRPAGLRPAEWSKIATSPRARMRGTGPAIL